MERMGDSALHRVRPWVPTPQPTGHTNSRGQPARSGAGQTECLWDPGHGHRLEPTGLWRCQSSALLPSSSSIHTPTPASPHLFPSASIASPSSLPLHQLLYSPRPAPAPSSSSILHMSPTPRPSPHHPPQPPVLLPLLLPASLPLLLPLYVSCTSSSSCLNSSVPFTLLPLYPSSCTLLSSASIFHPSSLLHPLSPPSCSPLGQVWKL